MRKLRRMWRGKFRVWCLTHGHRFRLVWLVLVLLLAFLLLSYFDWKELRSSVDEYRQRVIVLEHEKEVMKKLPKTVFVIEAATPEELARKMAKIAGELDVQRGQLTYKK